MRTTHMANENTVDRKWYVVDAEGERLGRLASEIASILRGKHKPTYTPHVDTGDYVIVINADKIELTGAKLDDKKYNRHSEIPGGIKERTAREMRDHQSDKMIEIAITGMLPTGASGSQMLKKLHVYEDPEHIKQVQKPEVLKLRG